jgi:cytidine deaminase
MNIQNFSISYEIYEGIEELSATDQALCAEARAALATSHSPYSKFRVGTAVRLTGNEVVLGSNQENVAYPSGLCAERVALFTVGSNYPGKIIEAMAITAHTDVFKIENPVTSCGACLQTMSEYEKKQGSPISIMFYCIDGKILKVNGVDSLLPFGFVETRLRG